MFRSHSPAQSSTSVSDNEDEDFNKSAFFAPSDALSITPAQWSNRLHFLPHVSSDSPPRSPASRLPPEILIHILRHLHSARDLYHALLVNRAWCECSVELLWYRPNFTRLVTLGKMMRVLSRVDQTFLYAHFIRRLNFLYLGSELTDSLLSRLAHCVRLERLTLINCSSISDEGLSRVLPCCPNLVALDLTGVTDITDKSIIALASSTKKLQGINLGGCKKLTDKSILALAANCPLLRRVKLSNVELITDEPVSALAKSCPLLLEIDLNNCKQITDIAIRGVWMYSTQMREMRLSHCVELTDAAFPAPPRVETVIPSGPNPFPSFNTMLSDRLPPLHLPRLFEQLRMLDLTACSQITDEAIEGIVAVAPKIRNLVLAKCTLLTDTAVENICKLGKHLHYLHLGHAGGITDRSIKTLARSCTRLRYIDLANCGRLTDMSVFELSSLQKLRRIGLVRVNNLTDQAIYALAERHATLERIHLSYCDQITVLAIHFLLQKLPKLTHLSLTGIPSFRRPELQQFCRTPPSEFNSTQRAAFCVYSGKGVAELREFLMELFNHITEESTTTDDTEYEYEVDYPQQGLDDAEFADEDDGDDEDEEAAPPLFRPHPPSNTHMSHRQEYRANRFPPPPPEYEEELPYHPPAVPVREHAISRDRASHLTVRPHVPAQSTVIAQQSPPRSTPIYRRAVRGFGHQPIIEMSTSPTPSDVASNRSGGTNHSTGTAFFRTYMEAPTSAASRHTVMTPDLVFAEIGHGRGAEISPSTVFVQSTQGRRGTDVHVGGSSNGYMSYAQPHTSPPYPSTNAFRLPVVDDDYQPHDPRHILVDSSNSYTHGRSEQALTSWTGGQPNASTRSLSSSPTTRELQDSIHTALGPQSGFFEGRESDARGRSVKRSLRNTITAAEQYASSFFGGRGSGGGSGHDGAAGPGNVRESDTHSH